MHKENRRKRLARLSLPILVGFVVLASAIVATQLLVFYYKYIPDILAPIHGYVPSEVFDFVYTGMRKIVVRLGVWLFILIGIIVSLIFAIRNAKKLLDEDD
jgi:hypothetical protein